MSSGKHSNRVHQKANSLQEIIDILEGGKTSHPGNYFPEMVWVGKNYSLADLIRDLKEIQEPGCIGDVIRELLERGDDNGQNRIQNPE